jgi:hypothetical protein
MKWLSKASLGQNDQPQEEQKSYQANKYCVFTIKTTALPPTNQQKYGIKYPSGPTNKPLCTATLAAVISSSWLPICKHTTKWW